MEQYKRHIPTILMHTMKGDVNQNIFQLSISFKEFNTVRITLGGGVSYFYSLIHSELVPSCVSPPLFS